MYCFSYKYFHKSHLPRQLKNITLLKRSFSSVSIIHPVCSFSLFLLFFTWWNPNHVSYLLWKVHKTKEEPKIKGPFLMMAHCLVCRNSMRLTLRSPSVLKSRGGQSCCMWQVRLGILQDTRLTWSPRIFRRLVYTCIAVEKHKGRWWLSNTLGDWIMEIKFFTFEKQ